MATTELTRSIAAPRPAVYRALLDPAAVVQWMVPVGMTSRVHTFDGREGGAFRISLTYDVDDGSGKSSSCTDTHHGRFVRLLPDEEVVQEVEFETDDPALQGAMTITYRLADGPDGTTVVTGTHQSLPPGVRHEDNELGWRMSMDKLVALVEGGVDPSRNRPHRPGDQSHVAASAG